MSTFPRLAGVVDNRDDVISKQKQRIAELEQENAAMRQDNDELRSRQKAIEQGCQDLRGILFPLRKAVNLVFGEFDQLGVGDRLVSPADSQGAMPDSKRQVWEQWKERYPGIPARIIDALLIHGELNTTQLSIVVKCHHTNVPKAIYKLNKAGLINKNGGKFSLKQI